MFDRAVNGVLNKIKENKDNNIIMTFPMPGIMRPSYGHHVRTLQSSMYKELLMMYIIYNQYYIQVSEMSVWKNLNFIYFNFP